MANGQNIQNDFEVSYFDIKKGPWARVYDMHKDHNNFLWLATSLGLYRFDGREYKRYAKDSRKANTLPNNLIYTVCEDNYNRLWVAGFDFDLAYLDRSTDTFNKVYLDGFQEMGGHVFDIILGAEDQLLLLTRGAGLVEFANFGKPNNLLKYHFKELSFFSAKIDDEGKIWIGTNQGVYSITNPNDIEGTFKKELDFEGAIHSIEIYQDKILLGVTTGFYIYNLDTLKLKEIALPFYQNSPGIVRNGIAHVKDNKFWISIACKILEFDAGPETFMDNITTKSNNLPFAGYGTLLNFGNNQVISVFRKGLYLFDLNPPVFGNIGIYDLNDESTEWGSVLSILGDSGDLWYGKFEGGLSLRRDGKEYFFSLDDVHGKQQKGYPQVVCLAKDSIRNRIWFGGNFGLGYIDLDSFDPELPKLHIFSLSSKGMYYFPVYRISCIQADSNGMIWVGTSGQGIYNILELENGSFKINHLKATSQSIKNKLTNYPTSLLVNDKDLWVGTVGGGLLNLEVSPEYKSAEIVGHYTKSEDVQSICSDFILDMGLDVQGDLWISTFGGLSKYLGEGKFDSWIDVPNVSNPVFPSLLSDNQNNIWLTTYGEGLIKYNPKTDNFQQYGTTEGIKNFDWSSGKFKSDEGQLYFAGDFGVTYFDPEKVDAFVTEKNIYLSDIKGGVDNDQWGLNNFEQSPQFNLRYDEFPLQLHFSTLGYSAEELENLYYRIIPGNDGWSKMVGTDLQLIDLPAGKYSLEVSGSNFQGLWDKPPFMMQLDVTGPWWSSNWAKVVYLLLIVFSIFWLYRFLLSRKLALEESRKLKEVNDSMAHFYSGITHDFRTPITVILGITKYLKEIIPKTHTSNLNLIEKNASNLVHMVDNIIELSRNEKGVMDQQMIQGDIVPYILYLSSSYQTLAELKHINFEIEIRQQSIVMDFDRNYIKSILGNLLSNAIKFTPNGGKISLVVTRKANDLKIIITDSGIGVPLAEQNKIFEKYYQSKSASKISEKGSGIGLSLTKQYVEILKGTIKLESLPDVGTKVELSIPVHNLAEYSQDPLEAIEIVEQHKNENLKQFQELDRQKPNILVVEDHEDVRGYLRLILNKVYDVITAIDGEEGVELATTYIPDLIICDVMLPDIDGFQVTENLKSSTKTDHIPIVMLTAKAGHASKLNGFHKGADAYLTKPFDEKELFAVIEGLIKTRECLESKAAGLIPSQKNGYSESSQLNFVEEVNQTLIDNYQNSQFGPKELAEHLAMSDSQLYRKIKSAFKVSPVQYIRSFRLKRAKILLGNTNKSITEISYEVGFNDASYFSKVFKNEYGETPTKFQ
ncbi:hypothetical protein BKM32_06425 [Mangrovimonas sp. DI 80]|nr:hypothetical protein BKM32_06425 [Mangrovimonas sp. DI 80]